MQRGHTTSGRLILAVLLLGTVMHRAYAATPDQDFQARCAAAGVLVCAGFDNPIDFLYSPTQSEGLFPPLGTSVLKAFPDIAVKASGASSLRFDILGRTGADVAGSFVKNFGRNFSQNSTFYVQFAQRFDSNFVSIDWNRLMGTSPKQVVFYDRNGTPCGNVELATADNYSSHIPIMYSQCGSRGIRTSITDVSKYTSGVPYLHQQGSSLTSGYNCQYENESRGTGNGTGCFMYPANKWVTFYYKVSVGTWGSANSSIQAWVSFDGGPYLQWTNVRDFTLFSNSSASDGYSRIMLTPYMTSKNSSVDHATAHTWYDELIISSAPIAAPGGAAVPVPNPPTDLSTGS